jgi:hypothetical protein
MAIARDTTAANIKPLDGAIVRRFTAHAAIAAGELVAKNGDSNEVAAAIGTSVILAPVGVAIAAAAAAGDIVDVVVFGPVQCNTGATPGALVYCSDTAGEPAEVGGTHTKDTVFGLSESSTVMFVRPQVINFS